MSKRSRLSPMHHSQFPGLVRGQMLAATGQPTLAEIHGLVVGIGQNFDAFKAAQNSATEAVGAEIKDIDKAVRDLTIKVEAGRTSDRSSYGSGFMSEVDRKAFGAFVRRGVNAAMQTQIGPDGGFMVPETVDSVIGQIARTLSPMRQYATVVRGGLNWTKIVVTEGSASGWVSETGSRPTLDGIKLGAVRPAVGEIYAMPAVTQTLLDTADFDVEVMLAADIAEQFAIQEGAAFINGNGINKPRGIATYDFVDNASWAWGKIGFVKSGDASGFKALDTDTGVNPVDCLVQLVYSLKPQHRAQAVWGMNNDTIALVQTFKNAQGDYIWRQSNVAGQPSTLLGYPVVEFPDMDSVASNKYPIMFGNLKAAYTINDVTLANVLRDPYSTKPYVLFYTTKRVGGGVILFDAVKFLKIAS